MELEADDDLLVLWDIDIVLSFCFYMLGSRIGFAFHTFASMFVIICQWCAACCCFGARSSHLTLSTATCHPKENSLQLARHEILDLTQVAEGRERASQCLQLASGQG